MLLINLLFTCWHLLLLHIHSFALSTYLLSTISMLVFACFETLLILRLLSRSQLGYTQYACLGYLNVVCISLTQNCIGPVLCLWLILLLLGFNFKLTYGFYIR